MGQNIILLGTTYENVPSITLPKVGGGVATFVDPAAGISNFIHGEFHTNETYGLQTVDIPYTGSGYPVMLYVCIKGGAYVPDTAWYDSVDRYAIGVWGMSKTEMASTPTYGTSGLENQGVTFWIYKNSTTAPATFSRSSAMTTNVYTSANATAAAATAIRVKGDAKTLSVYVAKTKTSYGLLPDQDYEYFIVYSS